LAPLRGASGFESFSAAEAKDRYPSSPHVEDPARRTRPVGDQDHRRHLRAKARSRRRAVESRPISPEEAGRPRPRVAFESEDRARLRGIDFSGIDCAIVTTRSDLPRCAPTFRELLGQGVTIVSTCEELSWPYLAHAKLTRDLDSLARQHGGRLLGTGVNPGS
jgi:hypothetical protein